MKVRLAVLLAVVAGVFGGAAVGPSIEPVSLAPPAYAKPCSAGYRHAALPWAISVYGGVSTANSQATAITTVTATTATLPQVTATAITTCVSGLAVPTP